MDMHRTLFSIAAISSILASPPVLGAPRATVEVQYVQPAKFTDFNIYGRGSQWSGSYFATQISDDLRPSLERKVPGGKLTLRFTDIDLAGHYPSRGGSSVRVVRGAISPCPHVVCICIARWFRPHVGKWFNEDYGHFIAGFVGTPSQAFTSTLLRKADVREMVQIVKNILTFV